MFEYILAGFTGTFFSYFCVFLSGMELYAFAKGTSSEKVIDVLNEHNERMERKMDLILRQTNT